MKATALTLGLALGMLVAASHAQAQSYGPIPLPQAPDACGWSYYQPNYYGQWYGPNYCIYPPFPPFQGMVFAPPRPPTAPGMAPRPGMVAVPGGQPTLAMPSYGPGGPPGCGYSGNAAFPSHQWARSPRDFFMVD